MSEKRTNDDSLATTFGRKMAALRKANHMTQTEFANAIGMSRSTVAYYESWARNPTLEVVEKVANFFNVSPNDLLNEETEEKTRPSSKLEQQFQRVRKLSPFRQRMISDMVEAALNAK